MLPPPAYDEVRSAEVIGALCLATDLGMGLPLEHGLRSTMIAMRLAERLGLDEDQSRQAFYGCLLFYVGCTADAETEAALFPPGALLRHFAPVMFGSSRETTLGILRALADPDSPAPLRLLQGVVRMPRAGRSYGGHLDAMCEVAEMLCDDLGMPPGVRDLFGDLTARWDGRGPRSKARGEQIPMAMRVIHVAQRRRVPPVRRRRRRSSPRDPRTFGARLRPSRRRARSSTTPPVCCPRTTPGRCGRPRLALEPTPWLTIGPDELDRALAAMGRFADVMATCFHGHAAAVSELAGAAACTPWACPPDDVTRVRRCGLVHDLGRVAVSCAVWTKPTALTADEWEQVRLHPYYTERVLGRSAALAPLVPIAASHHERLDGSGYHRGTTASAQPMTTRILAAADAYRTLIEPRPHRAALTPAEAADRSRRGGRRGTPGRGRGVGRAPRGRSGGPADLDDRRV